jgi:hypothetical protein
MPRHNAKQSREDRFKKFVLGGNQRKGNVFNVPASRQNERLQQIINKELGGK